LIRPIHQQIFFVVAPIFLSLILSSGSVLAALAAARIPFAAAIIELLYIDPAAYRLSPLPLLSFLPPQLNRFFEGEAATAATAAAVVRGFR